MGVGMQIVYLGLLAGSAELEAEAGAQLVRVERFSGLISGCRLAIEARHAEAGQPEYRVCLDLIMRNGALRPAECCIGKDANDALRMVFDEAEHKLRIWQGESALTCAN